MSSITSIRARFIKSSNAAIDLAKKKPKYLDIIEKMIKIKHSNAERKLNKLSLGTNNFHHVKYKLNKYKSQLRIIEKIRNKEAFKKPSENLISRMELRTGQSCYSVQKNS